MVRTAHNTYTRQIDISGNHKQSHANVSLHTYQLCQMMSRNCIHKENERRWRRQRRTRTPKMMCEQIKRSYTHLMPRNEYNIIIMKKWITILITSFCRTIKLNFQWKTYLLRATLLVGIRELWIWRKSAARAQTSMPSIHINYRPGDLLIQRCNE